MTSEAFGEILPQLLTSGGSCLGRNLGYASAVWKGCLGRVSRAEQPPHAAAARAGARTDPISAATCKTVV